MSRVTQFSIGAGDPQRAIGFYRNVFGWSFRPDGDAQADSWLITTGLGAGAVVNGGLSSSLPSGGYISTMAVTSVDDCAARVQAYGGQVIAQKVAVPGVGYLAYCKDTEENLFGIMQFDRFAGMAEQACAA